MFDFVFYYCVVIFVDVINLLVDNLQVKLFVGGIDVLIQFYYYNDCYCYIVDIYNLVELRGITLVEDGLLCIGFVMIFIQLIEDFII